MQETIISAINSKFVISFSYNGETRIVEPHCFGSTKSGSSVLRAFQTAGGSSSGDSEGWKLFTVEKMENIECTDETFKGPREGYNPSDPVIREIFCKLEL
ncbi:hypothetical protein D3C72_808390 [compost metagenome]